VQARRRSARGARAVVRTRARRCWSRQAPLVRERERGPVQLRGLPVVDADRAVEEERSEDLVTGDDRNQSIGDREGRHHPVHRAALRHDRAGSAADGEPNPAAPHSGDSRDRHPNTGNSAGETEAYVPVANAFQRTDVMPPSTKMFWPETKSEAAEHRNRSAPRSSLGSPQRLAGVRPRTQVSNSALAISASFMSVRK
jgi:hypothetical protein